MTSDETLATIRRLLDEGNRLPVGEASLALYARAHALDLNDPMAMSHHGMALAVVRNRYEQGIVFCEEAVRRLGPQPRLLLNLARAYLAARNKREGVRALRRALARGGASDPEIMRELLALGLRQRPVLPFLPRSFFVNRWLGLLRHRIERKARADDPGQPLPAEKGALSGDLGQARAEVAQELGTTWTDEGDGRGGDVGRDGLAPGARAEDNRGDPSAGER